MIWVLFATCLAPRFIHGALTVWISSRFTGLLQLIFSKILSVICKRPHTMS